MVQLHSSTIFCFLLANELGLALLGERAETLVPVLDSEEGLVCLALNDETLLDFTLAEYARTKDGVAEGTRRRRRIWRVGARSVLDIVECREGMERCKF